MEARLILLALPAVAFASGYWTLAALISIGILAFQAKTVKKRYLQWILEDKQSRKRPLVQSRNLFGQSAREVGTLPSSDDLAIEQPQKVLKGQHESIYLHMADDEGSWIIIKAEFFQANANVEILWNNQGTLHSNVTKGCKIDCLNGQSSFKAGDLTMTILEPLRRWRVLFNGMMRNSKSGKVEHVKMNLIWAPLASPFDWTHHVNYREFSHFLVNHDMDTQFESMNKLREALHKNGYDQWGAIFGMILLNDETEVEINYRGLRERILPRFKENTKSFSIIGVSQHGFHFTINQHFHQNAIYSNGHIFIPGCGQYPMNEIDCQDLTWMSELTEMKAFYSRQAFTRFKAGNRWFNVGIQPKSLKDEHVIEADMTFNCHRGFALIINKQSSDMDFSEESANTPGSQLTENRCKKRVLALSSVEAKSESISGGKGSSLAQMKCNESLLKLVSIPDGVIVTTAAFEMHLQENPGLKSTVAQLQLTSNQLCSSHPKNKQELSAKLEDECKSLIEAFHKTRLSHELASEIFGELSKIGIDPTAKFAVRSSAVGEDSQDLSSAGQNETFLGCSGQEAILEALAKCWGSLFAFQSVEYRRQNGQLIDLPMAVVIQEMVAAESAGVLFSRDPVTGNPGKIVITANYGLGESVVSAKSEPDTIIVENASWKNEVAISERKIGAKKSKIVMADIDTIEEVVHAAESEKICMSDEMALKLAKVAIFLEEAFNSPRDIEFAVQKEQIYLLQSRPITSFASWTDFDLQHEFDSAISSKKDSNSKANLGEVIPGATTPLTNFVLLTSLNNGIEMGVQQCPGNLQQYLPHVRRFLPTTSHHVIFNYLDLVMQTMESDKLKKELLLVDYAIFGHEVSNQAYVDTAVERRGIEPSYYKYLRIANILFKTIVPCWYMQKKGLPEWFLQDYFQPGDLVGKSSQQMYDLITEKAGYSYIQTSRVHTRASEASSFFCIVVFAVATGKSDWDADLFVDIADLMVSPDSDIVSAGVPTDLRKLATKIAAHPDSSQFLELEPSEADRWLSKDNQVGSSYKKFLDTFGHRCLREFDLISIPWIEDRTPLVQTLKSMVSTMKLNQSITSPSAEQQRKLSLEERIDKVSRKLEDGTKKALKFLLPFVYKSVALRERCKSELIKKSHEIRLAYRQLSHQLTQDGRLPDPELIFFLTHYELGQLIHERNPVLIQKASRRRRLRASLWDELRFPEMIHGIPKPLNLELNDDCISGEATVKGTPVCRGKYKGIAKVVTRLADAKIIQQGDVLITVSTDIGWSPYFPLLGGVVTELGGLISHGAVVAREYGLPCVVGAEGATKAFKTGDLVIIDGAKGTVSKIEE